MSKRGRIALALLAAVCVALTLLNASWLAPTPPGRLALVAHHGTAQQPADRAAAGCPARRIRPLSHTYIENTLFAMQGAVAYGARGFLLPVRTSADGHAVLFRDAALDCRTDGTGRVGERPLAYLKGLDVGHGYSADGGRTFPLRGRGIGAMPTAAEAVRRYPDAQLIFTLHDAADAEAIVRAFGEAGVAIAANHGFVGDPAALARLRALTDAGWVLDPEASAACLAGYRRWGWIGRVPASCRGATVLLPRAGGWTLWGWPYRFLDRMAGAGARLLIAERRPDGGLVGLERPEQLGEVPRHYRGLLLVDDMHDVGRSLGR